MKYINIHMQDPILFPKICSFFTPNEVMTIPFFQAFRPKTLEFSIREASLSLTPDPIHQETMLTLSLPSTCRMLHPVQAIPSHRDHLPHQLVSPLPTLHLRPQTYQATLLRCHSQQPQWFCFTGQSCLSSAQNLLLASHPSRFFCLFVFPFWSHMQHMEAPGPGMESKIPQDATAAGILNPLLQARDQTLTTSETTPDPNSLHTVGTPHLSW